MNALTDKFAALSAGIRTLFGAICLGVSMPGFADDKICINDASSSPTLDGSIQGDTGWLKASQYGFLDGSSGQQGRVQLTRDASNLYVSFEVDKLPEFNASTRIILLIGPDANDAAKDFRIHIYPGSDSGNGINSQPRLIEVWKNSNGWPLPKLVNCQPANDANCSTPTSLVQARVTAAYGPSNNNAYRVEIRITAGAAGLALPTASSDIKLAFNALRVYQVTSGGITETKADQLNWPTNGNIPGGTFPLPGPNPTDSDVMAHPVRANWGTASLPGIGQSCAGVRVKRNWINTPATPAELAAPAAGASSVTNTFNVEVENTGTTGAGNVLATISAWRFGSAPQSTFGKIGSTVGTVSPGNPVSSYDGTANPIGANQTRALTPMAWTLSAAQYQGLYSISSLVCSLIELDIDSAHVPTGVQRTQITNRYTPWNIHMAPASVFRDAALLDSRGYAPGQRFPAQQKFALFVSEREIAPSAEGKPSDLTRGDATRGPTFDVERLLATVGGLSLYRNGAAFFVKTVCPYRHTGRYIRLDGRDVELMERAPCFEYWIHHRGPMQRWISDDLRAVDGPGLPRLEKVGANAYSITLDRDQSAELVTRIEAVESHRYALWLALGRTIPNGSFSNQQRGGPAATLGFEYIFTPTYSVEATLGRHSFGGKNGGSDIDVTQFGANGKWYFAQPGFKPFVTLGVGGYAFDPGSTRFGVNLGAGVQVDVAPQWSVEGRYSQHQVTGNAPNSRYSTLQLGLRYAF